MPEFLLLWTSLFVVSASFLMKGTQPLFHVAKSFLCALLMASLTSISSTYSKRESGSLSSVLAPAFGLGECDFHPERLGTCTVRRGGKQVSCWGVILTRNV